MIERIRGAIQRWLGIDTLANDTQQLSKVHSTLDKRIKKLDTEKVADIDKRLAQLQYEWASLYTQARETMVYSQALNKTGKQLMEHFEMAVNVGIHEESWAVLIVHSKQPQLHFIDLRGADPQYIREMLTQFNGVRQTVDAPYGMPSLKPIKRL